MTCPRCNYSDSRTDDPKALYCPRCRALILSMPPREINGCDDIKLPICWRTIGIVAVIFGVFLLTPTPIYVPAAIAGFVVCARIIIPKIP